MLIKLFKQYLQTGQVYLWFADNKCTDPLNPNHSGYAIKVI